MPMIKNFTVYLVLALNIILGQNSAQLFKVDIPEFIREKSVFEISAIFRIADIDADNISVFIFTDNNYRINSAELRTGKVRKNVKVAKSDYYNPYGNSYRIKLEAADSLLMKGSLAQVVYNIRNYSKTEVPIGFAMVYYKENEPVAKFSCFEESDVNGYLEHVKPVFYKSNKLAGKAYLFREGKIDVSFKRETSIKNLLTEFWLKTDELDQNFLSIINTDNRDTLVKLGINKFRILNAEGALAPQVVNNGFISKDNWYHYIISINTEMRELRIYTGKKLSFRSELEGFENYNNIDFSFNFTKPTYIDQFRVWDFGNSINHAVENYKYQYVKADSSLLLYSNSFEGSFNRDSENENLKEDFEGYELVDSNAPMFSKSPEFNIEIHSEFYLLEWSNPEEDNISDFYVEKSEDSKTFTTIYGVVADVDREKVYSYAVTKDIESALVYYRIKQVNKDGEILYSPNIKIGQGEKDYFVLQQNFPNPFNPETTISVEILEPVEVELNIYDLVGKQIETLHKGALAAGVYNFKFNGAALPSGLYFYELKTPYSSQVRKMILAK